MLKIKMFTLVVLLMAFLVACSGNAEQALQDAEVLATQNADTVNAAATQVVAAATENADAVNAAATQVVAAATENADTINAAVTEVVAGATEVVAGATENADTINAVATEAAATAEAALTAVSDMGATVEAPVMMDYDKEIYGEIDTLDLNGVVVKFWHQHRGGREEELNAIIDEFNSTNPYGIIVEATYEGSYGDIYDKMTSGLTTGNVPSLVVAYSNQAASYQIADGLVSLEPYINHPVYGLTAEEQADFVSTFLASDQLPQFEGKSFGFPPNRSLEVVYYNQTWLEELGFDAPPATPEQFAEAACAASNAETGTVGYEISTDASRFASFVFARGGDIYDYETNQFTLNSQEAIDAMTWIQQLYADGCARLIAEQFGDQADFGNRITLFTIGSTSGIPFYETVVAESAAGAFEWSVAPVPYTTDAPVMNIYGASVSLPKSTPEQQLAAWLFVKFYTSSETQARWAKASDYFPVRFSSVDVLEADGYFTENPVFGTAFSFLETTLKSEPPLAGYDNVRDEISEAYSRILDGEDVKTVLDELNETDRKSVV